MDDHVTIVKATAMRLFFSGVFFACNHPGLISPDDGKINIVLIKFTVVSVNFCEWSQYTLGPKETGYDCSFTVLWCLFCRQITVLGRFQWRGLVYPFAEVLGVACVWRARLIRAGLHVCCALVSAI